MTGTTITDMLDELDAIGEQAAERDRRQSEHHEAALAAQTEADQAASSVLQVGQHPRSHPQPVDH